MTTLRIGLAQTPQSDNLKQNESAIREYLDRAVDAGVQILCFPEVQTAGYRVDITAADAPVQVDELQEIHASVAEYWQAFNGLHLGYGNSARIGSVWWQAIQLCACDFRGGAGGGCPP